MKKLAFFFLLAIFSVSLYSQKWNAQVQKITGEPQFKTITIKPGRYTTVGFRLQETDSLIATKYFDGGFYSGSHDSITLKLIQVRHILAYTNGIKQSLNIPSKQYLMENSDDTSLLRLSISEIDYLEYKNKKWSNRAEVGEVIIWGSLLALVASPFICYDYKAGELNHERYAKWAIGSTFGLLSGVGVVLTLNSFAGHKKYVFHEGWDEHQKKIWKFKL